MENDALQRQYENLACEGGFEARCHMELPERSLVGARVVNVGCRRGKGTYKLSEQVGESGFVIGADWSEEFVEAARAGAPKALDRSGLSRCNMAFRVGFPEDLAAAGIEEGWADFVYLNSSLSLFASPAGRCGSAVECWYPAACCWPRFPWRPQVVSIARPSLRRPAPFRTPCRRRRPSRSFSAGLPRRGSPGRPFAANGRSLPKRAARPTVPPPPCPATRRPIAFCRLKSLVESTSVSIPARDRRL